MKQVSQRELKVLYILLLILTSLLALEAGLRGSWASKPLTALAGACSVKALEGSWTYLKKWILGDA